MSRQQRSRQTGSSFMISAPSALRRYGPDSVLAIALALLGVLLLANADVPADSRAPDAAAYGLALLVSLPIAFRLRSPLPALTLSMLGSMLYLVRDYPQLNLGFFTILALYTVAAHEPIRTSLIAAAAVAVVATVT